MKNDLRIIRTKKLIKEAFISIVEEKGYNNTTVNEIAKKAMINRNTFYLHYKNKDDLINNIVNDVLNSQNKSLKDISVFKTIDKKVIYEKLLSFFNIINQEIELYRLLLLDTELAGYFYKLKKIFKETTMKQLKLFKTTNPVKMEYFMSGFFGIIERYIVYNFASTEEISNIMSNEIFKILKDDFK